MEKETSLYSNMDQQSIQDSSGYCKPQVQGKMDNLLEECWFFDNLLIRRRRYSRCNTDTPHASSSSCIQKQSSPLACEVYAEIIKHEQSSEQETVEAITDKSHKNKPLMRSNQGLSRAPSLPASMGMELKESCQECVPKHTKSSRQSPNLLASRKGHAQGRISRAESLNTEAINKMRNGYIKYQKNTRKTASALEFEEVQGFKDLGFNFDTKALSPSVVSILPGLQEKNKGMSNIDELVQVEKEEADKYDAARRKPYLSEAWQLQRSSSTIPNWVVKKSSKDKKAQLKSWAKTVASNVR